MLRIMMLDPTKARPLHVIWEEELFECVRDVVVRAFNDPLPPYGPTVHFGTQVRVGDSKYRYSRHLGALAWRT